MIDEEGSIPFMLNIMEMKDRVSVGTNHPNTTYYGRSTNSLMRQLFFKIIDNFNFT